ncbi:hypothetical protein BWQ96_04671 [Gracilariopsis chorda]|uniref:Uncharacterized protein n=1 Tax=Gracilariopsis chorda TaxID=448386 RepID=A0A2V3IU02_9FLOR|nr:hypothetical protein BWQ96_04671 [Gracilariopsis chorda]|eukprot:PXF45594.1 hypothetical protein BWQ96_04671 [Gracilariopsis chorda]
MTTSTNATPPLPQKAKRELLLSTPTKPSTLPSPKKTVWPAPPPSTPVGNWILHQHSFAPKRDYFKAYCAGLARRRVVDHLMWFRFPSAPDTKQQRIAVHYSRLAWVGGPLAELVASPTEQGKSATVQDDASKTEPPAKPDADMDEADDTAGQQSDVRMDDQKPVTPDEDPDHPYRRPDPFDLTEDDTPRTFAIVIKFLYCEEIQLNYLTFDELVSLAKTAHRWHLTDLYHATFSYVMDQDLLSGGLGIRTFLPLAAHEETPEQFRRYVCIAVGHHFDVLYPRLRAMKKANPEVTPLLWQTVFRQKMLSHVLHTISLYSPRMYNDYLLDVVLRYYEPHSDTTDDQLLGLLSQLSWDDMDVAAAFGADGASKWWSARAVRLAALAAYAPQTQALEVRIPWNIPLQRLLKQDVWSFQTEHVPCGPYICYLHVRKGAGREVSLFVHIWNRENKPLQDEARHEMVRVKCRATERNCRCDSSKQWSDSWHGFLENLRFEGKLERYPGLGWSQFLEEKRLDEWRNAHGEHCGLAITTVLQFVNPKKQFEGPAKRSRTSSPGRLQSPIQKKRSGSRMKLRESR